MMWYLFISLHVCACTPQKWAVTERTSPGMGEKVALWSFLNPGRAGSLLSLLIPSSDVPPHLPCPRGRWSEQSVYWTPGQVNGEGLVGEEGYSNWRGCLKRTLSFPESPRKDWASLGFLGGVNEWKLLGRAGGQGP